MKVIDAEKLLKGLSSLIIGTEGSVYKAAWNDAIRHVIMDVKTGCYTTDQDSLDAPAAAEVNADGLLPCPFCGNPNPVIRSNGIGDLYVICDGDEGEMYCEASTSYRRCETREGAIRRWNTRAPAGGGG